MQSFKSYLRLSVVFLEWFTCSFVIQTRDYNLISLLQVDFKMLYIFFFFVAAELDLVFSHVSFIIAFIEQIAADEDHTDGNVAACTGLIG